MELKSIKKHFGIALLIFLLSIIAGYIYGALFPESLEGVFAEWGPILEWLQNATSIEIFLLIFINNSIKSFIILILGVGFGLIPALFLAYNGIFIGLAVYLMKESGGWGTVMLGLMPHGIIEIPAILLAAAVGLRLGDIISQTIFRKAHFDIKSEFIDALGIFLWVILPMLFIAALIEAFVTSQLIGGI
ncbi:MAG: stage II sporulation protein M [Candidatus Syntropharchaeales archaeon]